MSSRFESQTQRVDQQPTGARRASGSGITQSFTSSCSSSSSAFFGNIARSASVASLSAPTSCAAATTMPTPSTPATAGSARCSHLAAERLNGGNSLSMVSGVCTRSRSSSPMHAASMYTSTSPCWSWAGSGRARSTPSTSSGLPCFENVTAVAVSGGSGVADESVASIGEMPPIGPRRSRSSAVK